LNYCFDIDGTICVTAGGDYESATPMHERIERVNGLYDSGNTIVYFTARGSTTGIDWTDFTRDQLESWGARYHRLILGKPEADVYVDDKGIHSEVFDWG